MNVDVVAEGLEVPWEIAFMPDGRATPPRVPAQSSSPAFPGTRASTRTSSFGRPSARESSFTSVVFPEPLRPTIATRVPAAMSTEIPSRIGVDSGPP